MKWSKIDSIKEIVSNDDVYDIELKDNHYFSANTIISHNCRLRSDTNILKKAEYTNSFGAGGISIGCYDEKTEVLTNNGWKLFKDLFPEDFVCTLNLENKEIEFQKPTAYMSQHYKGIMHHYDGKNLDLMVTPNHNMVVCDYAERLKLVRSDQITKKDFILKSVGNKSGRKDDIYFTNNKVFNSYLFFTYLGAFIGSGSVLHNEETSKKFSWPVYLTSSKKDKSYDLINTILPMFGKKYSVNKIKDNLINYIIRSKDLYYYMKDIGRSSFRKIPKDIFEYDSSLLKCLFNGLMFTNGTGNVYYDSEGNFKKKNKDQIVYYTTSKQLADDIQILFAFLAHQSTIETRVAKIEGREFTKYEVNLLKTKKVSLIDKRKEIQYNGMIYCVEVPNHTLLVRRNNMTNWCGNSHRVVTLNLPRIAYQSETDEEYMKQLEYNIRAAQDILDTHRSIVKDNIERGKLPLYEYNFMSLDRQFSTIGYIGLNEACEIQGKNLCNNDGIEFAKKILNKINDLNDQRSKIDGNIRNTEQIPGETAAVMFSDKDKILFTNHKYKIYSNQFIPLWKNVNIEDRIRLQGIFDKYNSGGAILHINVDSSMDKDQMAKLIEFSAKNGVIYFSINMNIAKCNNCGKIFVGKFDKSPCHNADMTNYMRVVGFLVDVNLWIPTRREEYNQRQFYSGNMNI